MFTDTWTAFTPSSYPLLVLLPPLFVLRLGLTIMLCSVDQGLALLLGVKLTNSKLIACGTFLNSSHMSNGVIQK